MGTKPPKSPPSSATSVLGGTSWSPSALELDDAALAPWLHTELVVEPVLSDRAGGLFGASEIARANGLVIRDHVRERSC